LKKNKRCFWLNKKIVGQNFGDFELLSLTKKGIIYKDINNTFGKTPESYETYQSVKTGQLVMCLFDLDISAVFSGISPYDGMISPAYKVYDCKSIMYNKYAGYWFDFCFDGRKYMSYSKSLRYVVNAEDFNDISIIVPPLDEQKKIANFLDEKVQDIDIAIEKTKETIEDYKKLKQNIITKTIRIGLDETVNTKDSGIEWVGEINENYIVCDFKYILKENMQYGANESGIPYDESLPRYVRITDIDENGNLKDNGKLSLSESSSKGYILNDGDILFARSGGTVGKSFIYKKELGQCAFAGYLIRAKVYENISPDYVYFYTLSSLYEIWKNGIFIQATIQNIGAEKYMNMPIILPKTLSEQKKIVDYLREKCHEIDKLIESKEKIVEELESYKKSVIYEYVTGKKEVK
jgi:type I restriction enzyme S subunit